MTVGELMEALRGFDKAAEVFILSDENETFRIDMVSPSGCERPLACALLSSRDALAVPCPTCKGTGKLAHGPRFEDEAPCDVCKGQGIVP